MSKRVFHDHIQQIWNKKDAGAIERFIAPTYRGFDPAEPKPISGIEGYQQHFARLTTAFPDLQITIEATLAEADRVIARWFVDATHEGDLDGIPPTGKRVHVTGISIAQITRDQLVEEHGISDMLGLLKQIGAIPDPPKVTPLFF